MTMTTCTECSHPVSSQARACPHCGAPRAKRRGCGPLVAVLLLGPLVIWAAVVIFRDNKPRPRDAVDDAYSACAAFESAGIGEGCTVQDREIMVTMGAGEDQAAVLCEGAVQLIARKSGRLRGEEWTLRIVSTDGATVAVCRF